MHNYGKDINNMNQDSVSERSYLHTVNAIIIYEDRKRLLAILRERGGLRERVGIEREIERERLREREIERERLRERD